MAYEIPEKHNIFIAEISKLAEEFFNTKIVEPVLVVSHYDADGLTAAAIMARLLLLLDFSFHIKIFEQIDDEALNYLNSLSYSSHIFLDMGSGQVSLLRKIGENKNIIIADHHYPEKKGKIKPFDNILDLNPHHWNIDGSYEISSAGIAYLIAKALIGETATQMAPIAIVGALGDRQDVGAKYKLVSLNRLIVRDGVSVGLVREELSLRLFGLKTKPLIKCLEYTLDPYLPGLSGNEAGCLVFLKSIGINPEDNGKLRYFSSLSIEEIRKLATELVKYLIKSGVPLRDAERIFGMSYKLDHLTNLEPISDAREFSFILNACGRLEKHGLGIALCLQTGRKYLEKALKTVDAYRNILASCLNKIREKPDKYVKIVGLIEYIDLGGEISARITGAISSILSTTPSGAKIIAISADKPYGKSKFSLRLKDPGLDVNLGAIVRDIASKLGGIGGGHTKAAGATIPKEQKNKFIEMLNKRLGGTR